MRQRRDHPRSRGEYKNCIPWLRSLGGSSPLSRGILPGCRCRYRNRRIIPALAGNTRAAWRTRPGRTDHPRSRGEYPTPQERDNAFKGSSPLSRGIPQRFSRRSNEVGIIPALAGNTAYISTNYSTRPDHPRSRGEYQCWTLSPTGSLGSSPLSRGIPRCAGLLVSREGIIPALAGNTP